MKKMLLLGTIVCLIGLFGSARATRFVTKNETVKTREVNRQKSDLNGKSVTRTIKYVSVHITLQADSSDNLATITRDINRRHPLARCTWESLAQMNCLDQDSTAPVPTDTTLHFSYTYRLK